MLNIFRRKKQAVEAAPAPAAPFTVSYGVAYSYEWKDDVPISERDTESHSSRPFCKKLMELGRAYTRAHIETMSQRLGYSVWDRRGGDGCRHRWVSQTIKR